MRNKYVNSQFYLTSYEVLILNCCKVHFKKISFLIKLPNYKSYLKKQRDLNWSTLILFKKFLI